MGPYFRQYIMRLKPLSVTMGEKRAGGRIFKTMRTFFKGKSGVLLLAVLGLISLAVLASGLRDVSFRSGRVMAEGEAQVVSLPVVTLVEDLAEIPLWKQLAAWAIVFLIVLILSSILSPEFRRRVMKTFLRFSLILAALYYLARNFPELFKGLGIFGAAATTVAEADPTEGLPPPVFEAPQVSPLTAFLVSTAVIVALALLFWAASRWWSRKQAFFAMQRPMDELAGIARDSLQKLSTGSAWDDVIVDSYMRMSEVVERRRGLARHHAVTPSEFADHLEKAGLPGEAVRTLTRLFESVRYGARRAGMQEKDQAAACLTAILNSCGEPL